MNRSLLVFGDTFALLIINLIGFITHAETDLSFLPRFFAASIPLILAWFLLAPWFGLFQQVVTSNPKQLWRPVFVMVFAAPFAALLRSLTLNTAILPSFVVVFGATSAFSMLLWRGLYLLIKSKC
jgi:hypothetical protein